MRFALLTGAAAALSLIGAAGAQAETVYVETAPGYVYDVPAPVVEPGYRVVPRDYVVVAPEPGYVVERSAPREIYRAPRETYRAMPQNGGIVTTGYSTTRKCMIDSFGYERCF